MFKYIKFKLIVILLTSNLYASQKIEVFYDPFYYEDINKLLGVEEGSIIDKYKFGKVQNNGSLSDESLIQEIDKLQKKLDFEKKSVDIKVTPKNEIIEDKRNKDEKRASFLENIDDRFEKLPNFIEDEKTGEKIKSNVEIRNLKNNIKINELEFKEIKNTK